MATFNDSRQVVMRGGVEVLMEGRGSKLTDVITSKMSGLWGYFGEYIINIL